MKKMTKTKKAISLGLALLLTASTMLGCGNKAQTGSASDAGEEKNAQSASADTAGEADTSSKDSASGTEQKAGEEQITITAMLQYTSETEKRVTDYAIERMKEIMPEVNLVMEIMPEDGDVTLKTRIAAGTLPDIWKSNTGLIYLALESDNVLELDKYVEETGILERTNPGERGVYWAKDGHCYAIPSFCQESYLIFYNKKVFEENNVKIPTNYSEFLDAVKTFRANDVIPLSLFAKDIWCPVAILDSIVTRDDPRGLVPIDTGEARMTEEVYVKSATKLKELIDAGLISHTAFTASNDEAMAAFANNEAAMYANGCWAIRDLSGMMEDGSFGYLDYPLQDGEASEANKNTRCGGASIGGYSIAPYSEHPDVAAKYACLLAMELANANYKYGGSLSSFTMDEGIEQDENLGSVATQYAEDSKDFTSYTLFPWCYDHADSMVILGEEISKLMTGDYAVEDFIENTDRRITEMLEEAGE